MKYFLGQLFSVEEKDIKDGVFVFPKYVNIFGFFKTPFKIKKVESYLFDKSLTVKEIILPDTILKINKYTFSSLDFLEKIKLPNKIKEIEDETFSYCKSLKEITLPASVEKIGRSAFYNCESLKKIKLGDNLKTIEIKAFSNCEDLEEIIIPNNIEVIKERTFYNCESLKKIKLSDNLKTIETLAFYCCKSLENIELPKNLEEIGEGAFSFCKSLKEIIIPNKIETIKKNAFVFCDFLKKIKLSDNLKTIESSAFEYNLSLEKIEFPKSLEKIEEKAFYNCQSLKEIIINNEFVEIEDKAFYLCNNIKKITYNNLVYEIKENENIYEIQKKGNKIYILDSNGITILDKFEIKTLEIKNVYIMANLNKYNLEQVIIWDEIWNLNKKDFFEIFSVKIAFMLKPNTNNLNMLKQGLKNYEELINQMKIPHYFSEEKVDFFKMCYALGIFNGDKESATYFKKIIESKIQNNEINLNNLHSIFDTFNLENSYNKNKALLIINALKHKTFINNPDLIARIYNEYEIIKKFVAKEYKEIISRDLNNIEHENKKDLIRTKQIIEEKKKRIKTPGIEEVLYYIENNLFQKRENNKELLPFIPYFKAINQDDFDRIQDIYEKSKTSEDKSIIQTIDKENNSYTYQWSSKDNPINFILGYLVKCCAKINGVGEDIMIQSAINKDISNLVIRDENKNIVAKSTAYYNKEEKYILFNNVEAVENVNKKEAKKAIIRAVDDQILNNKNINEIRIGMLRNDVFEKKDLKIEKDNLLENYKFNNYAGDANNKTSGQGVLYFKPKIFDNVKVKNK